MVDKVQLSKALGAFKTFHIYIIYLRIHQHIRRNDQGSYTSYEMCMHSPTKEVKTLLHSTFSLRFGHF